MVRQALTGQGNLPALALNLRNAFESVNTPAFVYDLTRLARLLDCAAVVCEQARCKLLYSVKASALNIILREIEPRVDGFATSSLFEARLVRDLFHSAELHVTTPGIRPDEIRELGSLCDFISFNSRMQLARLAPQLECGPSLGVRANTRISHVRDQRYDPCGKGSKLGIPIEELERAIKNAPALIDGLHFHTNADSHEFGHLLENVEALAEALPQSVGFAWVNLGGGYLFEDSEICQLVAATELVRARFGAIVYLEPGAALVRDAGFLVASVLDIVDIDGVQIAVLDTTVNHMPEVLEFGYQPNVLGETDDGSYEYTLAGSTCLAGDKFGRYRFGEPLAVGHRIVFEEAGAYAQTKAHRFNGINFPSVGVVDSGGQFICTKTYTYEDYKSYWTADA